METLYHRRGNVDQGFLNFRTVLATARFNYRITERVNPSLSFHPITNNSMTGGGQTGFRADWDAHNRDRLTLQGDIYYGDAGTTSADRELLSAVYDRCATERELSGAIARSLERDLGSGSDFSCRLLRPTNRKQATLPSLEIRLT